MTKLYLLEPENLDAWLPFGNSRPVSELRAGVWLVRERWEAISDCETEAIFGPKHLNNFQEHGVPPVSSLTDVSGPSIVGRSDFAPSGVKPELSSQPARLTHEGEDVGWWVPEGHSWNGPNDQWTELEIEGIHLRGAYDLVTALELFLVADLADFTQERGDEIPDECVILGNPADIVLLGAFVEPGVTFDVRNGAVVVEEHAYVRGGTRLEGPVYVGPTTEILGGDIRECAFGPRCRVRGEISSSVFMGFANKSHEGFLGHSVLGRWVNLGAGTTTSNLKNTYGEINLDIGGNIVETGRRNIGTLFGDYSKTAIGTLLGTGTIIGAGANVFGDVRPPRHVSPFAWGADGVQSMHLDGFLKTAEIVFGRRQVKFDEGVAQMLTDIYRQASGTAG